MFDKYYTILGLTNNASTNDIKKAWKNLKFQFLNLEENCNVSS